jgi:hypothetical protein
MVDRILYRLINNQGLKSEIREMDDFMPSIYLPYSCTEHRLTIADEIDHGNCSRVAKKEFVMKSNETVQLITYEEK